MTENSTKRRLTVLGAVILFLFASLLTRLWFLQGLAAEGLATRAENNRVRIVPDPARRGRILARQGQVLISNRPSTIVYVDRTVLPEGARRGQILDELSELLGVSRPELGARLESKRYYAYEPLPIAFDVPEPVAAYLAEHNAEFPGVHVDVGPVRDYPWKRLGAHLLGYTGEISAEELTLSRYRRYRQGTLIGKAGIERVYETDLQGRDGLVSYEVDVRGEVKRRLGVRDPEPGDDLVLSIDLETQQLAESSLATWMERARNIRDEDSGTFLNAGAGAVVVMNPNNGQILAMASNPSFNPAKFIGGITKRDFDKLRAKAANFPLFNRAIQAAYPPGSTFKPFVAAAAFRTKITTFERHWDCPSEFSLENDPSETVFHNWRDANLGFMSVAAALIDSCDTVFYQFGQEFYSRRVVNGEIFQQRMEEFGLGSPTSIDLPNEEEGRIPDVEWVLEQAKAGNPNFADRVGWLPGDDINMSIGQGNVLTSPLQLATAYSALANGGTLYEPRIGLRLQRPDGSLVRRIKPVVAGRTGYSKTVLSYIRDALSYVPRQGTAAGAFAGFPFDRVSIAGKTGTAEMDPKQPFSWFAAMAPANDPKYVVVAMVEEGGHGSQVAAPIVREIFEGLFDLTSTGGPDIEATD